MAERLEPQIDAPPPGMAPGERRRHYRVTPDTSNHLDTVLLTGDDEEVKASLLDASTAGIRVELPGTDRGAFSVGGHLTVRLSSERLDKPLEMAAEVKAVHFGGERPVQLGLAFRDWGRAEQDFDPAFRRLFNQRARFRVEPTAEDLADMRLVLRPVSGAKRSMWARLADLSVSGLGIHVQGRDVVVSPGDPSLAPGEPGASPSGVLRFGGRAGEVGVGERVQVSLRLPKGRMEHVMVATIRHIRAAPGARFIRLGVSLPDEKALPRATLRALEAYVTQRQREMRRRETEERERLADLNRPAHLVSSDWKATG